ncbi:MAG: hypothetical protein OEY55_14785, partial [Acidimicrobiia bacterium]|nr:hypothetical protein [Acidimicrobiia bacterium]
VLAILAIALRSPASQPVDRALRRAGRSSSDDLAADAIRGVMERPGRVRGELAMPTADADAAASLAALSARHRLALVLHHGLHWPPARIGRALGVDDGSRVVSDAEEAVDESLRPRLAWEIDHQLRTIEVETSSDRKRRLIKGSALLVVGVSAILIFLSITQANIKRPDLIQLRPGGLLRADAQGQVTRLIEEQVSVAKVTPDNEILYQFSGGPGVAGGSIWYSPGPAQRAGQLIGKTGGALGWVEADFLPAGFDPTHRHAIAIVAERSGNSASATTTHSVIIVDPATRAITPVVTLGTSIGSDEASTGGFKPVFASYGGDRVLVWVMDAVAAESLPSDDVTDCGQWLMFTLTGDPLPAPGPDPSCARNGLSTSVPTLDRSGSRLMWLETTGTIDPANPPREGWLSSQTTVLRVLEFASRRQFSIELASIDQPTFWAQFTMFSQETGTLSIDSEGDVVVVSIGFWNPDVAVYNYTTYLVDLVGERVETSASDGPVTFGH